MDKSVLQYSIYCPICNVRGWSDHAMDSICPHNNLDRIIVTLYYEDTIEDTSNNFVLPLLYTNGFEYYTNSMTDSYAVLKDLDSIEIKKYLSNSTFNQIYKFRETCNWILSKRRCKLISTILSNE
jgi:hypothetical protein